MDPNDKGVMLKEIGDIRALLRTLLTTKPEVSGGKRVLDIF